MTTGYDPCLNAIWYYRIGSRRTGNPILGVFMANRFGDDLSILIRRDCSRLGIARILDDHFNGSVMFITFVAPPRAHCAFKPDGGDHGQETCRVGHRGSRDGCWHRLGLGAGAQADEASPRTSGSFGAAAVVPLVLFGTIGWVYSHGNYFPQLMIIGTRNEPTA